MDPGQTDFPQWGDLAWDSRGREIGGGRLILGSGRRAWWSASPALEAFQSNVHMGEMAEVRAGGGSM